MTLTPKTRCQSASVTSSTRLKTNAAASFTKLSTEPPRFLPPQSPCFGAIILQLRWSVKAAFAPCIEWHLALQPPAQMTHRSRGPIKRLASFSCRWSHFHPDIPQTNLVMISGAECEEGFRRKGWGRSTAEHTAEPVDQRVIAAIASQGPDHAGEGRERIRHHRRSSSSATPSARSLPHGALSQHGCWSAQCLDHPGNAAGYPGHRANRVRSAASSCPHPTSDGRGDDRSPLVSAARPRRQSPPPLLGDMPAGAPSLL